MISVITAMVCVDYDGTQILFSHRMTRHKLSHPPHTPGLKAQTEGTRDHLLLKCHCMPELELTVAIYSRKQGIGLQILLARTKAAFHELI